MALRLFLHAFQTIFRNFGVAIRISVLPMVALVVFAYVVMAIGNGFIGNGMTLILIAAIFFVFGYVATSWHRFVLLEEEPRLNGPAAERSFPYIWKSFILGLWMLLVLIPVFLLMILVGLPLVGADQAIGSGARDYGLDDMAFELVFGTIAGSIGLMYSMILPATAVVKPMTLRESRLATMPLGLDLVLLAFLISGTNIALNFFVVSVFAGHSLTAFVMLAALQWLLTMVSISILTSLYGHLVEGRDLPS